VQTHIDVFDSFKDVVPHQGCNENGVRLGGSTHEPAVESLHVGIVASQLKQSHPQAALPLI
jgi:hypothetical protein